MEHIFLFSPLKTVPAAPSLKIQLQGYFCSLRDWYAGGVELGYLSPSQSEVSGCWWEKASHGILFAFNRVIKKDSMLWWSLGTPHCISRKSDPCVVGPGTASSWNTFESHVLNKYFRTQAQQNCHRQTLLWGDPLMVYGTCYVVICFLRFIRKTSHPKKLLETSLFYMPQRNLNQ